jgi:hypothetical protein
MNKYEANQLLDRCRETSQLSYSDTTRALKATGDYEADGSEGVDSEVQAEVSRPWENESIRMVVADLTRHGKKAWVSRR